MATNALAHTPLVLHCWGFWEEAQLRTPSSWIYTKGGMVSFTAPRPFQIPVAISGLFHQITGGRATLAQQSTAWRACHMDTRTQFVFIQKTKYKNTHDFCFLNNNHFIQTAYKLSFMYSWKTRHMMEARKEYSVCGWEIKCRTRTTNGTM